MIRALIELMGTLYADSGDDQILPSVAGDELSRLTALASVSEEIAQRLRLAVSVVEFNATHPPVTIHTEAPAQDAEIVDTPNQPR